MAPEMTRLKHNLQSKMSIRNRYKTTDHIRETIVIFVFKLYTSKEVIRGSFELLTLNSVRQMLPWQVETTVFLNDF